MYRGVEEDHHNDDDDDVNNDEFEAAAREVGEQLTGARVPEVEATVARWLCRLTAAGRGANELHHLRLLRLMVANGRVGRPFLRPPPATGRLLPLNVYLRPRSGARPAAATVSRDDGGDAPASFGSGPAGVDQRRTVPEESDGGTTAERDGHLAGGGGKCVCRPDAADGEETGDDAPGRLCDPCLDRLGLRLRPGTPKPLDAAFKDLLGDCAAPRLTAAERRSLDPGLLRVMRAVDDATTLQEFNLQVSLHTRDRGSLLMSASDDLVDNFRAFVRDVLESRTERIGNRLVDEQMWARDRYARLRDRALNRAAAALDHVREALPAFDWRAYQTEPDAYLRRQILRRAPPRPVARDDGGGGGDEDQDEDGRSAAARALSTLDELRSEAASADRSSCRLLEERAALAAGLAELDSRLSAARARQATDVGRLRDAVTLLRNESADQKVRIDRLTASIQLRLTADDEESC